MKNRSVQRPARQSGRRPHGRGRLPVCAMHRLSRRRRARRGAATLLHPLLSVFWFFSATLTSPASTQNDAPLDIGGRRQVFIDGLFLASSHNVKLVAHPPRKTGEHNLVADQPWERGGLGPYSCVLKDGEVYRMWYHAMDTKLWHTGKTNGAICYATSPDGITWTKPDLGLVEYQGSRKNNIVVGHGAAGVNVNQDGMMVFVDPNAPPDQRYRMVNRFDPKGEDKSEGVNLLSSGDGIHWRLTHQNVLTYRPEPKGHHLDSQNVLFWDEGLKKYVAFVRRNLKGGEDKGQGRAIARAESDHLGGFPPAQDLPVVFYPEPEDPAQGGLSVVDYYNSAALRYPWADRAYYLFPQAYYHYTRALREFSRKLPVNAGPMETAFAASRDGLRWERYDRAPFIPLGLKGEFDCHSTRLIYGLVPDLSGREMYLYYRGSDWLHGWDRTEENRKILTDAGVGADRDLTVFSRVVLRRDGFVSVRADYRGGEFTTPPLKFTGRNLKLNLNTSATGRVRVACLNENGEPIPGYALTDCDLLHTANEINRVVKWQGNADVSALAGKPIRLRFVMHNTDLYAFQFQDSP
jgi:hypothetical protein